MRLFFHTRTNIQYMWAKWLTCFKTAVFLMGKRAYLEFGSLCSNSILNISLFSSRLLQFCEPMFWQICKYIENMSKCRRMQIDPYLSSCTKLKSKWIKDRKHKSKHNEPKRKKVGSTLKYIGTGDYFLNRHWEHQLINGTSWNGEASIKQRIQSTR